MQPFLQRMTVAILSLTCGAACGGEDIDEAGAESLWQEIREADYRDWARPPEWSMRQPTVRAHGETADVFINSVMEEALAESGLTEWPVGSILVKDSYDGDEPSLVAAMQKEGDGWFFAEWEPGGAVKFAGYPDVCVNCHRAGDDFVLTAALP